MSFENLKVNNKIIDILNSKKYIVPTDIQKQTYSIAANGHDVIGVSKTGSGKTLAFILPILNQLMLSDKAFHTLIITPTRELAIQISDFVKEFDSLGIRHASLIGGELFTPQVESINKYPHIIIGTPGRIVKHILKTKNFKINLIKKLVFDEADRFFEQDFTEDLDLIAVKLTSKNQTLMFTATLTNKVEQLSKIFMKNPRIIGNSEKYERVTTLKEYMSFIPDKYKLVVLYNYIKIENAGSLIIFVEMSVTARKIANLFEKYNIKCKCLYGSLTQNKREEIISQFKNQDFNILITTDLASRGLDILHVNRIINYDLPKNTKDYVHRVGRTARAGNEGTAISFVTQYDIVRFQKLEYLLQNKMEVYKMNLYENYEEIMEAYETICNEMNRKQIIKKTKKK